MGSEALLLAYRQRLDDARERRPPYRDAAAGSKARSAPGRRLARRHDRPIVVPKVTEHDAASIGRPSCPNGRRLGGGASSAGIVCRGHVLRTAAECPPALHVTRRSMTSRRPQLAVTGAHHSISRPRAQPTTRARPTSGARRAPRDRQRRARPSPVTGAAFVGIDEASRGCPADDCVVLSTARALVHHAPARARTPYWPWGCVPCGIRIFALCFATLTRNLPSAPT